MNPDYYSDVKLAERFFFENSIYLLNMFEKKVDSFISNKTRQARERDRIELSHPLHIIDPDGKTEDPIRALSKDLTKPIWHCVTKTDAVAVCVRNPRLPDGPELVSAMNDLFARFLLRLKHEHEDESNFRLSLSLVDRASRLEDFASRGSDERVWPRLQELLGVLGRVREKYERDLRERNQRNDFLEAYLEWSRLMLEEAMANEEKEVEGEGEELQVPAELYHFVSEACKNLENVIESAQGPTVLNYWPNLRYLPDLVHPLLMAVYVIVRGQLHGDRSRQNTNASVPTSQQNIDEESGCVFEELPERNFSKITFLNLDGHDSPYNLTLAKSLSRYLQYISFPCEDASAPHHEAFSEYFKNYSEFLVKHYVQSELTEEERQLQHRLFRTKGRTERQLAEYYRHLLVFPVHSHHLSQKHDLQSAEFYQSKFVKFVMKELVYIQIKEFNPSVIVVSASPRLQLETEFFEELVKELTVIGNMRVLLYNNLTRSYMFEAALPARFLPCQQAHHCHRLYARAFDRRTALLAGGRVNLPLLHRTALFLKIASGTHSLDRALEEDCVTEKYEIFRVQKYAGTLIKLIGKGHPVLERFRNRCNEYLRLERMLSGIYEAERAAEDSPAAFPLFHRTLLDFTRRLLDQLAKGEPAPVQAFLKPVSREYVETEWEDFALRFRLAVKKEREEEDYKFITRLRRERQVEDAENWGDFIALEFEIVRNGVPFLVNIAKHSQICFEPCRQGKAPLVYLFNHLPDHREPLLRSYCGEVDAAVEESCEGKVRLGELELPWQPQHPFQSLSRFNYLETPSVVLLFWPTLYDQALALASRFLHAEYEPPITGLIFAADRAAPHRFTQVTPANASYVEVLPRAGCTCYQVPSTELVYIFGGFYAGQEDYLRFQTDITVARLGQQLELSNVPKNFYFDYEPTNANLTDLPHRITRLAHDFVRPRVEYEVYELEKGEDLESSRILLVGGVGEKFLRPYSMIGYMAHQLAFARDGALQAVRRLRLNNVVPANLRRPLRIRAPAELPTASGAQNRQIYLRRSTVPAGGAVFSWFHLKYEKENEKMTYTHGGDLALLAEPREERAENTLAIRENNSQVTTKVLLLRHYSSLKEVDNKLALVYQYGGPVEQSGSVIFTLELELAEEVYLRFVNLSSRQVPLTGSHLVAVDTLGLEVFAVLRHEEYTGGRCVLAHCDIGGSVQALVEASDRKIVLREVYRFDGDMRHSTVKALPDRRVALVHAFPMYPAARLPECILKRTARGHFVREEVANDFPSYALNTFLGEVVYRSAPVSFFYTGRQAVVSWSFRSSSRGMGEEEYFFLVEELNCREEAKRWRLKTQKTVRFQKMFVTSQEPAECVTTILDIRVTAEKKYEVFLSEGGRIYVGSFDAHLESSTNTVTFREYDRPPEEYEMEKFRHKFNVEYLQKLTKHPSRYLDVQEEMEAERAQ